MEITNVHQWNIPEGFADLIDDLSDSAEQYIDGKRGNMDLLSERDQNEIADAEGQSEGEGSAEEE